MKYSLVSGKIILARVIRALGYKLPSTYYDDVLEWIAEGLGFMQVTNSLVIQSTGDLDCPGEIITHNHSAALPCGFVSIIAVEDSQGNRLPMGGDITDLTSESLNRGVNVPVVTNTRPSSFQVDPYVHQTSDGLPTDDAGTVPPYYISGSDINSTVNHNQRTQHYYKLQGNRIQTSFESDYIKIHYYAIPVDEEGYPLIPDNQNFMQALEWHIIKRLIGSGYQHSIFTYQFVDEQYEKYAARGMGEVSFYTPEGAAKLNRSLIRLIPPYNLYEDFFVNSESPERLAK